MRVVVVAVLLSGALASGAAAQAVSAGSYLCSVEQQAHIGSTHLERAGPPETFSSDEVYRFRLVVTGADGARLRIQETPYDGPQRSTAVWEDDNSALHGAYVGDGRAFTAERGPGFLNFGRDRWGANLQFYHAGFQYAGGEDESVAVRWGRCAREQ